MNLGLVRTVNWSSSGVSPISAATSTIERMRLRDLSNSICPDVSPDPEEHATFMHFTSTDMTKPGRAFAHPGSDLKCVLLRQRLAGRGGLC